MSEFPTNKPEVLKESELHGAVADVAAEAFRHSADPIELFNSRYGIAEGEQRMDIDPELLKVRDALQKALAAKVLARGVLASGEVSRASSANDGDVYDVAVEAYERSLLASKREMTTAQQSF